MLTWCGSPVASWTSLSAEEAGDLDSDVEVPVDRGEDVHDGAGCHGKMILVWSHQALLLELVLPGLVTSV